ncbi:MAG: S41 family peptidase [Planctomycetota bacterium]|nr:S41 family peptidase [Planctomycetota bacterium]
MGRGWTVAIAAAFVAVLAGATWGPLANGQDAAASAPAVSAPAGELSSGVAAAVKGRFQEALSTIEKLAGKGSPDAQKAETLLREHLAHSRQDEVSRKTQFDREARRVAWCLTADRCLETLAKDKDAYEKFRAAAKAVSDVYEAMPLTSKVENAALKDVEPMRKTGLETLTKIEAALKESAALAGNWKGEYAEAFGAIVKAAAGEVERSRKTWTTMKVDTEAARREAVEAVRDGEVDLAEAVSDVDAMVAEKPWQEALTRARMAELYARPADAMAKQDWYRRVVAEGDRRGKEAVAAAKWYDALSAYAALEALEEDNEGYKKTAKAIRQHVRVLGLYGNGNGENGKKKKGVPAGDDPETAEVQTGWKDMVANIDADMVKTAIGRLKDHYVTSVDFEKVTRGALEALRILAETPQAAKSFPKLADADKRGAFVKAIDDRIKQIEARRGAADADLELSLALNAMIRASEQTVDIPTEVVVMEFTDGALGELDKFSSMIWPYDVQDFVKGTMGHFCGVGVQISKEQGEPLKVVSPLPDTPGFAAGIRPGDLILAVDGDGKGFQNTQKLSVDKCVRMITGPENTRVVLRISRPGMPRPFDVTVTRKEIQIRTVKGWRCLPDGGWDYLIDPAAKIGYVRLSQFTKTTGEDLHKVLEELRGAGVGSPVLDLRRNPGGLLNVATDVVDEFISRGTIVSTRGRQVPKSSVRAKGDGTYLDGDVIVLVNQYSASAAEIVSGALQDNHRCIVLGKRSYGKGSVQNVIPIKDGDAFLKLTTAHYYVGPSEILLHRTETSKTWGVEPDVEVELTPDQARRWVEMRHKSDILQDVDPAVMKRELDKQLDTDVQLNTAVLLLQLNKLAGGKLAG